MTTNERKHPVALVTGATSGIGKATALALAAKGAHVLVHGRDEARGVAVVGQIRTSGGKADFVGGDLRNAKAVRDVAANALRIGGGCVDILVNNVGIFPFGPTATMTDAQIDDVLATNVRAPFLLVGLLAPAMVSRGKGAIVNITTMAAERVVPGASLYGASKASLAMLTKYWANEFGQHGVRVNEVSPGPTRTEGTASFGEGLDQLASLGILKRVAKPEEIAATVVFLALDDAAYVQGASLAVDGGFHAA